MSLHKYYMWREEEEAGPWECGASDLTIIRTIMVIIIFLLGALSMNQQIISALNVSNKKNKVIATDLCLVIGSWSDVKESELL